MSDKYDLTQIRSYWTSQATKHGQASSASWSDKWAIDLEIRQLLKWINDGDRVIDVGCANGFTAAQIASQRDIHILGLDYIPEMIKEAQIRTEKLPDPLSQRLYFAVGDIRNIEEPDGAWDKAIVVRTIINLGDWNTQCKGLKECLRVVRPGGLLLLSEATLQGWRKLNRFRVEWGLTEIPIPQFNTYIDEEKVTELLCEDAELVDIVNFASTYFVGTRILKPILAQQVGADINPANPEMEFNRWIASLPSGGDYGTQKLLVFRKRN